MILLGTIVAAIALAVPVTRVVFETAVADPVQKSFDREFASIVASHDWS